MGEKLKLLRHKLRKKLMIQRGDTPAIVAARMGQTIAKYNSADVEKLLVKWCDPTYQDYCAHMKDIRARNQTPHYTGLKSYARVAYEDVITLGKAPMRAKNYIKTHRKKDGS